MFSLLISKNKQIKISKKFKLIALSILQKKDNTLNMPININERLKLFWLFKLLKKNIRQIMIGKSLYEKASDEPVS